MRIAVSVGPEPGPEEPRKEPPRKDPPLREPPHKDPPPHEPPRQDPEPETPVKDPPPPGLPPNQSPPPTELRNRARLEELLRTATSAMLTSRVADGTLRHRPGLLARLDEQTLYVATALDASHIVSLTADPRVDLVVQSGGRHAALAGTVEISTDRALIARLWSAAWVSWFPAGAHSRDLTVLVVRPRSAEYWDGTGMRGAAVDFEAA